MPLSPHEAGKMGAAGGGGARSPGGGQRLGGGGGEGDDSSVGDDGWSGRPSPDSGRGSGGGGGGGGGPLSPPKHGRNLARGVSGPVMSHISSSPGSRLARVGSSALLQQQPHGADSGGVSRGGGDDDEDDDEDSSDLRGGKAPYGAPASPTRLPSVSMGSSSGGAGGGGGGVMSPSPTALGNNYINTEARSHMNRLLKLGSIRTPSSQV